MRNFLRNWVLVHMASGLAIDRIIDAGLFFFHKREELQLGSSIAIFYLLMAFLQACVLLSVVQWLLLRRRIFQSSRWIPATIGGSLAGSIVYLPLILIFAPIFVALPGSLDSGVYLCSGIGAGLAQWLILKKQFSQSGWWILANSVGTAVTLYLHLQFSWIVFWKFGLANVLWGGSGNVYEFVSFLYAGICWAVYGFITGFVMIKLLAKPHNQALTHSR